MKIFIEFDQFTGIKCCNESKNKEGYTDADCKYRVDKMVLHLFGRMGHHFLTNMSCKK